MSNFRQNQSSLNNSIFSQKPVIYTAPSPMTAEQFSTIATFMENTTGIKMPLSKRTMIQSRLSQRLKALNFTNYSQYINYVFSPSSSKTDEVTKMIDLLTTNLTYFFREKAHFDFMTNNVLPYLVQIGVRSPEIWCAACSSGEETYTLAIVMKEFIAKNPGKFFNYSILATDISTRILSKAVQGIYPLESIEKLPLELRKKYFLKCKDPENPIGKVKRELKTEIRFDRLNLMDSKFNIKPKKDIIFCRNVLIYFDKETQINVIRKLLDCLKPGGFLFLGHSETILGADLPIKQVSNSTFQKIMES